MENKHSAMVYGIGGFIGTMILTLFDQWTKHLAVVHLANNNPLVLIPGVFELRYLENRGAAFGIMQNKIWIFAILTIISTYLTLPSLLRRKIGRAHV